MKKILYLLLCIPLIFNSCEEEDNPPSVSPPSSTSTPPPGTTGYWVDQVGNNVGGGTNYNIFKTTDSGISWSLQSNSDFGNLHTVDFVD